MDIGLLRQDELAVWFDYEVKGVKTGELLELCYVPRDRLTKVFKKATKKVFIKVDGKRQTDDDTDTVLANELFGEIAVKDWKGFTDGGKEAPCSRENVRLMMSKDFDFSDFVNEKAIVLSNFIQEAQDTVKKKSLSMASG